MNWQPAATAPHSHHLFEKTCPEECFLNKMLSFPSEFVAGWKTTHELGAFDELEADVAPVFLSWGPNLRSFTQSETSHFDNPAKLWKDSMRNTTQFFHLPRRSNDGAYEPLLIAFVCVFFICLCHRCVASTQYSVIENHPSGYRSQINCIPS